MAKNGLRDHQVANNAGVSRVQISRIRRGVCGASVPTARRLEKLTKIKWHYFVGGAR